ncbi:MAG: hypothetical protein HY775_07950 [Acidobacteria bacterium]|nr:hypothetical protein [Acidobacteriota bacterium]
MARAKRGALGGSAGTRGPGNGPALDERGVRALASLDAGEGLVVSLTLDADGRRFPRKGDYEALFGDGLRRARAALGGRDLPRQAMRAAESDLERVARFVTREFDRGDAAGLALFVSSPIDLWTEFHLPRAVGTRIVLDRHPHVLRLEALLATGKRTCTVIVSRNRARIFSTRLGRTAERSEILDDVPGKHEQGGWSQARFARHVEEHAHRHLRRTAEAVFEMSRGESFDHLIVAGPDEVVAEFEKGLHPWLAERVAARLSLAMTSGLSEVRAAVLEVERAIETERTAGVVERLLEEAGARRLGAIGLEPTLKALADGRAETLIVADGPAPDGGFRCLSCRRLHLGGGACAECGGAVEPVQDLAEELVDEALRRRCEVVMSVPGAVPGGVGALLRY